MNLGYATKELRSVKVMIKLSIKRSEVFGSIVLYIPVVNCAVYNSSPLIHIASAKTFQMQVVNSCSLYAEFTANVSINDKALS